MSPSRCCGIVISLGHMTEVQARAYRLAGNKGTDRSMQDGAAAGSMLEFQTTPFKRDR